MLATWVDDLIFAYRDKSYHDKIMKGLEAKYTMTDLGELTWVVGMRITRDRAKRTTTIDQEAYCKKILETFNEKMDGEWSKNATPFNASTHLDKTMEPTEEEQKKMENVPYRSAMGALMYLAVATRPDIACAWSTCARFAHNPGEEHWKAVKRIFRYLADNPSRGLIFNCGKDQPKGLDCSCDSDWGENRDNRRSRTGYECRVFNCLVSWKSVLQKTVSLSSTEAEYKAASDAAREVLWLRQLLAEIIATDIKEPTTIKINREINGNYPLYTKDLLSAMEQRNKRELQQLNEVPTMKVDNQGAIKLATNPVNHERTKHIDIRHHFLRENVSEFKKIKLEYVNTKMNNSDIFTKTTHTKEAFILVRDRVMGQK